MAFPLIQASFAGGEITPELWGRVDLQRWHIAASTLRNMFVNFRGGANSRAGFRYVATSPQSTDAGIPPRVFTFSFSSTQGYALEFGDFYLRFIFQGGYVLDGGGSPYTLVTPYAIADVALLKFTQSADVMSIAHRSYPPHDLVRLGPANWSLTPTVFGPKIGPPTNAIAVATTFPDPSPPSPQVPTLPAAYAYQITAVDQKTGQESIASNIANVTNSVDISVTAGSLIVSWDPVPGAQFYKIYRAPTSYNTDPGNPASALPVPVGALFGLEGSAFGTQFVDSNIVPDFSQTPPQNKNPFAPGQVVSINVTSSTADWTAATFLITSVTGSGFIGEPVIVGGEIVAVIVVDPGGGYAPTDTGAFFGTGTSATADVTIGPQTGTYPGEVAYFQQRRVYAQTFNQPDTYFMSQPGAFTNFGSSIPVSDADAIIGTPWSQKVDGIQWMVSMPLGLVTFTGSGVWQVTAPGSVASSPAAITPSNQLAAPQSEIGCSESVPPLKINWEIVYAGHNDNSVWDLTYQIFFNIYAGTDISWMSTHLLIGHQIKQWAYQAEPFRIVWIVRDDGLLLSLTYLKEQEVTAWARHDTLGQVRSICCVAETDPVCDAIYIVVERPVVGGTTAYFIERMDNRLWDSVEDVWAVDAAVALPQPAPTTILTASAASGNVTFRTPSADVFNSGNIGWVIRSGGGIATIAGFVGAREVTGTWNLACVETYPNDPLARPVPQPSGKWTLSQPFSIVGGLDHLEGQTVSGLADGVVIPPRPVTGGSIQLDFPASQVVVGLPYTVQGQSIYVDTGQPTIQGRRKAIYAATVRAQASGLSQVGANQENTSALSPTPFTSAWSNLAQATAADVQPQIPQTYTSPGGATVQPLYTGDQRVVIPSDWDRRGFVAVQQTKPVPLNILALVPEIQPGDTPEVEIQARQPQQQGQRRAA